MTTKVYIIESEAGWGQKVDEVKEFPSAQEAEMFCREYNRKYNPPGPTPEWYMYAHMEGKDFGMLCGLDEPLKPAPGSQVLTEHIKVCGSHPMRKAEADIALLRSALAGLIGADSEDELRQMEIAMRLLPAPDADKAVSINAIHALLATMTPNAKVSGAGTASAGLPG